MWIVGLALLIACPLALILSIWPGWLQGLMLPFMLIVLVSAGPAVVLLLVLACICTWNSSKTAKLKRPSAVFLGGLLLAIVTGILLKTQLPLRIAFRLSRSDFDAALATPPAGDVHLGVYQADAIETDRCGGTYFRVTTTADGLGPDTLSCGFVYQPNQKGTPFGAARYKLRHLTGSWYSFCASDDW